MGGLPQVLEWASLLQHPASAYIRTVSTRYSIAPADLENSDATVAALGEGVRVGSAPVAEEPDGGAGLQTGHRRSFSATPTPGRPALCCRSPSHDNIRVGINLCDLHTSCLAGSNPRRGIPGA